MLTNRAMPGLVKIGKTKVSVEQRVSQLSAATSTPFPFKIAATWQVIDANKGESVLHQKFSAHRTNRKREFFELDATRARELIDQALREAQLLREDRLAKGPVVRRERIPILGYAAADQMNWWRSGG